MHHQHHQHQTKEKLSPLSYEEYKQAEAEAIVLYLRIDHLKKSFQKIHFEKTPFKKVILTHVCMRTLTLFFNMVYFAKLHSRPPARRELVLLHISPTIRVLPRTKPKNFPRKDCRAAIQPHSSSLIISCCWMTPAWTRHLLRRHLSRRCQRTCPATSRWPSAARFALQPSTQGPSRRPRTRGAHTRLNERNGSSFFFFHGRLVSRRHHFCFFYPNLAVEIIIKKTHRSEPILNRASHKVGEQKVKKRKSWIEEEEATKKRRSSHSGISS